MHFATLSAAILGLATAACAGPILNSPLAVRDYSEAVERGMIWAPRGVQSRDDGGRNRGNNRNNRNKNNIIIAQNVNIQLTQVQIIQEVQIVNLINNIIVIDGQQDARDNVRKNHYRNRNRNVNTIIIVVVQIVDVRNAGQRQNRYLTRQIEANPGAQETQWVVLSEASTITADPAGPTAGAVAPTAVDAALQTGVLPAAVPTAVYDPNAELQFNGQELLLPAGAAAPRWPSASNEEDPAIIIEADQVAFVVLANENNDNNNRNGNGNGNGNERGRGGDDDDDKKRD